MRSTSATARSLLTRSVSANPSRKLITVKSDCIASRWLVSRSTSWTRTERLSQRYRRVITLGLSFVVQSVAQWRRTTSGRISGRRLIVSATPEASVVHQYALTIGP